MENIDLKKIINYRPPLLISLLIICSFFFVFLYFTKTKDSYAISYDDNEFSESFETKLVTFGISSDTNIKVNRIYDENNNQIFSYDMNDRIGNYYVKDKKIEDSGLLYILSNSYPNIDIKDNTGNSVNIDFQTWITQVSIWSYLNKIGIKLDNSKLEAIKNSKKIYLDNESLSSNKTVYEEYIKDIVNNALNIKPIDVRTNVFLDSDVYMTKDNKYYQTSLITVSSNDSENFKGYFVNLDSLPVGSFIVDSDGEKIDTNKKLKVTDNFYVRVPKNRVDENNNNFKLDIIGVYEVTEAYLYKSEGYSTMLSARRVSKNISQSLYIKF